MDPWMLLFRISAMLLLFATLAYCRRSAGSSPTNIPYWISVGMLLLYCCYCFSGIEFENGQSGWAELGISGMVTITALGFTAGVRREKHNVNRTLRVLHPPLPRCSWLFTIMTMMVTLIFFTILTSGQPWRIFTDGVELKWERLSVAADKDASLLLMDAIVFASVLLGLSWAIISYRDDRRSALQLLAFATLTALYTISTGSRTPLIAVGSQIIGAVFFGRYNSKFVSKVAASSGIIFLSLLVSLAIMVSITASRVEFEQLDSSVFESFFDIKQLGIVESFAQNGSFGFFLATLATYAASTYNNAVIRLQEIDAISLSHGYKFVFFYVSALRGLTGELLQDPLMAWRDLATVNNVHLLSVSLSATQWATLYGDAVWDFGYPTTVVLVAIVSYLSGRVIERAKYRPRVSLYLLAITVIGFSLSPLVNPFLSLHVHFMLLIVGIIHIASHTSRRSRRRIFSAPNQVGAH